ncbi:MAG: ornithine cyclodeaminase family protein [Novosphingobium sp.]
MSSQLRIIDGATIRRLAPPDKLIGWMREAMIAVSRREVELPLRRALVLPGDMGAVGMMPGYVGAEVNSAGVKLVSLVPPARRKGSSHLGLMVLYDADGLVPEAILCGGTVTAVRTSAATANATDLLARKDASKLAILGSGEQAAAHIDALRQVRSIDEVRIWGIDPDQVRALAKEKGARACTSVDEALAGADIVCTLTAASEPILFGRQLAPGMHVNLVGSSFPDKREADDEVVTRSRFFIDYLPSTMDQAGEFLHARAAGLVEDDHIQGEIGAVATGEIAGRQSDHEITVYKSLGVAAQDIVTARRTFELARVADLGTLASV